MWTRISHQAKMPLVPNVQHRHVCRQEHKHGLKCMQRWGHKHRNSCVLLHKPRRHSMHSRRQILMLLLMYSIIVRCRMTVCSMLLVPVYHQKACTHLLMGRHKQTLCVVMQANQCHPCNSLVPKGNTRSELSSTLKHISQQSVSPAPILPMQILRQLLWAKSKAVFTTERQRLQRCRLQDSRQSQKAAAIVVLQAGAKSSANQSSSAN